MSTVVHPGVHRVHPLNTDGGVMDTEKHQRPHSTQFKSIQDSPSQRTGPPRSLSFAYSLSIATSRSKKDSNLEEEDVAPPDVDAGYSFASPTSDFRGALEYISPTELVDRKGKRRESRDEGWSPRRWFHESPKAERAEFDFGVPGAAESHDQHDASGGPRPSQCIEQLGSTSTEDRSMASKPGVRPALSIGTPVPGTRAGHARWRRLRLLIPHIISQGQSTLTQDRSAVVSNQVNITDELISGGLATLMPRLWFERDEKNHRRVPVLLHRLRIRVSDSLHPMHSSKAVFRIECEYANGASRWVVYRQLRDFLSLHTHYTVSNIQNHNVDKMPEFPRTSLPYFKYLKKEGRDIGQAEFARLQRESLENYLLDLIRAVMFHPSSNRIAAFLEISALSISLARSGGAQYKAGVLHIECSNGNSGGGFGRKSIGWRARKEPKWCALREGYLVVLEEPGELKVWDVFILDSEFRIERPKRYYRQGLNFLNSDTTTSGHLHPSSAKTVEKTQVHLDSDCLSVISSIKSRVSKIFHVKHVADDNNPSGDYSSSSSSISLPFRTQTPLLDPSTNADPMSGRRRSENEGTGQEDDAKKMNREKDVSKHTFYIVNSQMRLKISAHNERQTLQWITALEKVATTCLYTGHNRFDSFAPVRLNVATQWLVDGRDYFWNLSRAILLARESIYIHDWWLSPEVELRRPNKGHYRLERLLERKAKEGVMIYIILYQEVSSRTTPTDSNYAKQRLLSLHPNILVQRSPSHFQTGTFYWAHHEKLCVIDQTIAFTGGLDLCFGRWDTPQHILTDDIEGTEQSEIWPGKDYSNPRISDFYELNKPEEDMYDRTRIPRMPWHDVALQVVGQPARDLARHFIQRWNYLLRIKNHSRTMPFLLPPPEFRPGELSLLGLTGTCEMQICRSAGPWSMGSTGIEQSIQNACLKAIQMSEHFVYIENQFFITSTIVNDVKIENHIGDAIVHRIIRAHREGTNWKCCVIIPLLPGFTFPVDHSDASAIRIILACQNNSISRGPYSIFGRLRREGINPDDYISFFSLRNWAKMRGDVLTTEQVYVHAKVCIVDDRFAIIGSANINERSQRGDRDSELAAVIRDTDLIDCTMGGQPFKVGRFAHLLRVRLMREHLGIDVDALDEADIIEHVPSGLAGSAKGPEPDSAERERKTLDRQPASIATSQDARQELHATQEVNSDHPRHSESETVNEGKTIQSVLGTPKEGKIDAEQQTGTVMNDDDAMALDQNHDVDSELGTAQENGNFPGAFVQGNGQKSGLAADGISSPQSNNEPPRMHEAAVEAVGGKVVPEVQRKRLANKTSEAPVVRPHVEADKFEDPISDAFWKDVWVASAAFNTEIYRKVFHAIPDDTITTWKQYKEFIVHHERLNKRSSNRSEPVARVPSEAGDEDAPHGDKTDLVSESEHRPSQENTVVDFDTTTEGSEREYGTRARHSSRSLEPFEQWEKDEMEEVLTQLNGHLVSFPTRFLEGEDEANNFLFNADRMLPLPIYN